MNSFIGLKKGIYLFEFDNSYSWINGKTIHYEAVVLAPYDLSGADYPEWLNVLNEQTVPIKQEEEDK